MDSQTKDSAKAENLRQEAIRKTKKSKRLLKKIDKELSKPKSNLRKVLRWQEKSRKQLARGIKLMEKREDLIKSYKTVEENKTVHFSLEKKSEKFVKKFNTTACVYQATMEKFENLGVVKVRDVLRELETLFTEAIEQVISIRYLV
jgi:hypothetical protein